MSYLQKSEIQCQKYHYTVDGAIQNMDTYCAMLRLTDDAQTLVLENLKPSELTANEKTMGKAVDSESSESERDWEEKEQKRLNKAVAMQIGQDQIDERMNFRRVKSKCSFRVEDITGFIFGGFGSRFWVFRKHICGMDTVKIINNLPFYCW